jgi:glycine cleavage system H protein
MSIPINHLLFTPSHEWIESQEDLLAVGLTEHGQFLLGPITHVEFASLGKELEEGQEFAMLETAKTAWEIGAPVRGRVAEVNDGLIEAPLQINAAPYRSWLAKILPSAPPVAPFLSSQAYATLISSAVKA